MIIWYRNSILASIISIIGCCGIIGGIGDLLRDASIREMTVPQAAGMIIGGFLLAVLGKIISMKKADKKAAKAPASFRTAAQSGNAFVGKTVGASVVLAGVFYLLAAAMGAYCSYVIVSTIGEQALNYTVVTENVVAAVLMIAAFWMRKSQAANVLHLLGFAVLTFIYARNGWGLYRIFGFEPYLADDGTMYNALALAPFIAAGGYFLMTLFSVFSMRGVKASMGIVVRILWILPVAALALVFVKNTVDSGVLKSIMNSIEIGHGFRLATPQIDALSQLFMLLAVFFNAYAFQRCCKKVKTEAAPAYSAPAQTYAAPVQMNNAPQGVVCPHCGNRNDEDSIFCQFCGNRIAPAQQAEPQISYSQPAQTAQPANNTELQKQIIALKDLLDCGILSQEEYDKKIRELCK